MHAVRDPSRDCPELVPMEEASALLLDPAPAARQFATPQPDNLLRSVLCRIQGI